MRVIPVIDIKDGLVVRAVAGQRDQYQPVVSRIAASPTVEAVADALRDKLSFDEVYVADLDAIAGGDANWTAYELLTRKGFRLWLDAGVSDAGRVAQIQSYFAGKSNLDGLVVGLESVAGSQRLAEIFRAIGDPRRAVFSLDLKHGQPLTRAGCDWCSHTPLEIAECAIDGGFQRLIVLDLAAVGTRRGSTVEPICEQLRRRFPRLEIVSGGGVRDGEDLERLAAAGCDAALVATALHDGRITRSSYVGQRPFGRLRVI